MKKQSILLIVFLFYSFCLIFYVSRFDYNISVFSEVASHNLHLFAFQPPKNLIVFEDNGYDGQLYYFMAQDYRNNVDGLRYQRIIYPTLAKIFAFNLDQFIPYTLILVNLASILIGTFFFIKLISLRQANLGYAYLWAFNPGYLYGFMRNLAEPLMITLVLIGIYCLYKKKIFWSSLFFAISILTKEVAITIVFPLILFYLIKKQWKNFSAITLSVIPFIIWGVILCFNFGYSGFLMSSSQITIPFIGFIKYILNADLRQGVEPLIYYLSSVPVFIYALIQGYLLLNNKSKNNDNLYGYILFSQILLILALAEKLFQGQIDNLGRYGISLFLFSLLYTVETRKKMHWSLIALLIGMSLFIFITKVIRFRLGYFIT